MGFGVTFSGELSGSWCPRLSFAVQWVQVAEATALCLGFLSDGIRSWGIRLVEGREIENLTGFGSGTRPHSEGVQVKVVRRSPHPHQLSNSQITFPRNIFFFYERHTGVGHF